MLNSRVFIAVLALTITSASAQPPRNTAGKNAVMAAANRPARSVVPAREIPAIPARITFSNSQLAVEAHNSDLAQILEEIGRVTGMSITGLKGGKRVFGTYGPGDARSVLTGLLQASGYNFLLVGADTPRELVLMPKTPAPPPSSQAKSQPPDEYEKQYAEIESSDPY